MAMQSVLATPMSELNLTPAIVNAALQRCKGVEREVMGRTYRVTKVRRAPKNQAYRGPWLQWCEFALDDHMISDWFGESDQGIARLLISAGVYEIPSAGG